MQGIGAPDEDRSGGFERGGWTTPLWDNEAGTVLNEIYARRRGRCCILADPWHAEAASSARDQMTRVSSSNATASRRVPCRSTANS
jgi:hypothetical protein